jgi:hypothetical protein
MSSSKVLRAVAVATTSFALIALAAGGASAQSHHANPRALNAKSDDADSKSENAGPKSENAAGNSKNVPYGLCRAYGRANSRAKANAKSFARLRQTAAAAGTDVAGLCANVAPPGLSKSGR